MKQIVAQENSPKGGAFTIELNQEEIEREIHHVSDYTPEEMSSEQRLAIATLHSYLDPRYDWKQHLPAIARKKDGTFKKNSVLALYNADAFAYEDEDSYGQRMPQLRLKVTDDYKAVVQLISYVEKW